MRFIILLGVTAALAGCPGCECSTDADCPKTSDVCVEGTCTAGALPSVPADGAACAIDADCEDAHLACFEDVCTPAPSCQPVNADLSFFDEQSRRRGTATMRSTGCTEAFTFTEGVADNDQTSINRDGIILNLASDPPTEVGRWSSSRQAAILNLLDGSVFMRGDGQPPCDGIVACEDLGVDFDCCDLDRIDGFPGFCAETCE